MKLTSSLPKTPPMWLVAATIILIAGAICFGPTSTSSAQSARKKAAAAKLAAEKAAAAKADAAQAPTAEGEATSKPATKTMTLYELLKSGGYFMFPIAACSLLGLTLIIERMLALRTGAVVPSDFIYQLKNVFHHTRDDREKGLAFCRQRDVPISRVLAPAIAKFHKGEEIVERAVEDAAAAEVLKLKRNMQMLFAVAATSPMLGLLGTVWGMIQAFQQAATGQTMGKAETFAEGIYTALVTTLAGLCVAIPVMIFYYYFRSKIERLISNLNDASIEFAEHYFDEGAVLAAGTAVAPVKPAASAPVASAAPATTTQAAAPVPSNVIEFHCDACQAVLRVPADRAGKKGSCPKCKAAVVVPSRNPA